MLALLICGQDIRSLSLGLVRDGRLERETTVACAPEAYLREIVGACAEWSVSMDALDAIGIVTGPGSFTSSRISTTIADALSFCRAIPVIAVENAERRSLRELTEAISWDPLPSPDRFAVPTYDRPPFIT